MRLLFAVAAITCLLVTQGWADSVTFAYSGRVRVQGTPFDGTGNFKFAIVSNNGMNTYWSNDGTSSDGSEPADSIAINVVDGNFSVNVGDTSLGMDPINRTVFNQPNQIKLRLWFSDGSLGFEHLLPDANLNNVDLLGQVSDDDPTVIFVDGTLGSDDNDGLTMATAKQTINGAVEIVPARLKADVTIKIAPGTYNEGVSILGISTAPGVVLRLVGDESWLPSHGGAPSVRVSGADDLSSPSIGSEASIFLKSSTEVEFEGLHLDFSVRGFHGLQSTFRLYRCKFTDCTYGLYASQSHTVLEDCVAESNSNSGFRFVYQSIGWLYRCAGRDCMYGLYSQLFSIVTVNESGDYSSNSLNGVIATESGRISFAPGYTGTINNNGNAGLRAALMGYIINHTANSFSGNTGGDIYLANGGFSF